MNVPIIMPSYVRAGERVLWRGKPSLLLVVGNALGFFLFLVFFGGGLAFPSEGGDPTQFLIPLLGIVVFALILVFSIMRLRRTEYVITDQSIYTRSGIVGQSIIQTTYDKITDIALRQTVVGRIFGYSTLQVNTAGSNTAPVQMHGLPGALRVKQRIEQAREAFLQRGRGPQRAQSWQSVDVKLPRFTLARDVITLTCPRTKKPFKRPRADVGQRVLCAHCGQHHLVKEASRGRSA